MYSRKTLAALSAVVILHALTIQTLAQDAATRNFLNGLSGTRREVSNTVTSRHGRRRLNSIPASPKEASSQKSHAKVKRSVVCDPEKRGGSDRMSTMSSVTPPVAFSHKRLDQSAAKCAPDWNFLIDLAPDSSDITENQHWPQVLLIAPARPLN